MQATTFIFGPYGVDWDKGKLEFDYAIEFQDHEPLQFTERIELPKHTSFHLQGGNEVILQNLSLILGISYYKLYVPPKIKLTYPISEKQAEFWDTVYKKGLGEFWYRNNLDPAIFPGFPHFAHQNELRGAGRPAASEKALVGIGGGKDSIVAVELLKQEKINVTGFVVETQRENKIVNDVVETLKIPVLKIKRFLDPKLLESRPGSYNGHVPISAVYAWLGLLLAHMYGFRWVVVGNEYSSNFGNVNWMGLDVNHQWSKSQEFETLFQNYVREFVTEDITYFSILRPFSELRITQFFTQYPRYLPIFSSCNKGKWCGACPKCAFVFTMLAAFLPKEEVVKIFGKDLFQDKNLATLFQDLSGRGDIKPFDCVGTFEEMQAALWKVDELKTENGQKLFSEAMRVREAPTRPHRFFLAGIKKALILGYGREGKITEKFLKQFYPDIEIGIADQRDDPTYVDKQKDYDVVIKTPGIPKRLVHIPYTTATNIFFSRVQNVTVGVTGSKGKSTTASLIAAMLGAGGKKVLLLGNIGKPMLEALLSPVDPEVIFVLELSSQQLEDMAYSPNIAIITALFPEHMDYHGSVEAYYAAKQNIFRFQRRDDVFLENRPEIPVPDCDITLLGAHNRQNIRAAMAVAQHLRISDKAISQAIRAFKPLPHRLEFVGEFRGVKFYDNASSTTPESTIEALKTIPNIQTMFLGGLDRGYNFINLILAIKEQTIKNIVLFPDTGARLKKLLPKTIKTLETRGMEEAVRFAYEKTEPGKAVLLSAASPSYSVWTNFDEQGNEFQKWVKALA